MFCCWVRAAGLSADCVAGCATASDNAAETQEPAEVETPAPETTPKAEPKANTAPRTQQKIPSLYID